MRSESASVAEPTAAIVDALSPDEGVIPVADPFERLAYSNRDTESEIEDKGFSEYAYAQRVAQDMQLNLTALDVKPSDISEIAGKVVRHAEQPHGDFSFFLFYMLCRRAHEQGKIVMFTGDGPDGKSRVIEDAPATSIKTVAERPGYRAVNVWRTTAFPCPITAGGARCR